jgi:hypothetical protein
MAMTDPVHREKYGGHLFIAPVQMPKLPAPIQLIKDAAIMQPSPSDLRAFLD